MTEVGYWFIGFALFYTVFLIFVSQFSRKKAADGNGFFVGGRGFNSFFVAVCITGLFSGSSYIAILELSYLTGISAIWYGVAETIHVLIIALVLITPFRKKALVTISGLLGDRYGEKVRGIAGAITAFTFPMWSVATALAFASALSVFTGVSLIWAVTMTAVLLLAYLQFGGMWSIGFTQLSNVVVFFIMLVIGTYAFFINPGVEGIASLFNEKPQYATWDGAGIQTILAWFGTFLFNVILAQAAFQMALSCKTPEEGRKGLLYGAVLGIPLILGAVLFGLAAQQVVPGQSQGLVAIPLYLMETLPAPLVGLFFLGFWAAALSWGAPCQFSGATSLGRDTGKAINPKATELQLVRYTKWSLVLLTVLMISFALIRSEQSAWWNVLAWVTRNSATFAPVVAALFWPAVTKRAALISLFTGSSSGLLWYHLGGWAINDFYQNIHPVWIGMIVNILTIVSISLIENAGKLEWKSSINSIGTYSAAISLLLAVTAAFAFNFLYNTGLLGIVLTLIVLGLFTTCINFIKKKETSQAKNALLRTS
ncbi:sodium:solute symporter [[Bacillus] enclensis]|uniref:Solute:Na+ symporter, SSS family n=1 Tax=[Bacillus] enclensis TaxID=1402860 RepID=A0A0V8HPT8_9BACI|nr:sodium:solute symporter family protein [[Bacillus] enclensis]KSU64391.1 sodium:solute symporter [[Bacillus] enclensis]SCB73341.1 solute:Na+ symporter, SSS family [[Bacillus] enclensis]